MKDPYSILGVSSDATDEEVKNAYRTLARKYHPDNYGDDNPLKDLANEKMQEINSAYDEIQRMRSSGGGSSTYRGGGTYYDSYSGTVLPRVCIPRSEDLLIQEDFSRPSAILPRFPSATVLQSGITFTA